MSGTSANDSMLEMFLFEETSLLEKLDEVILNSEKNQSLTHEDVNEVFRIMHTIKGSSAMMEFSVIASVTHKLEDCFYLIRENGLAQQHFERLFDLMLDATDFLKSQLEAIQNGTNLSEGNDDLIHRATNLYAILSGKAPSTPAEASPAPGVASGVPAPAAHTQITGVGSIYGVEVLFEEDCGMENLRAFMLVETLRQQCNVISYEPADVETNSESASYILVHGFSMEIEADMQPDILINLIESVNNVKTALITHQEMYQTGAADPAAPSSKYSAIVHLDEGCGMENLRCFMLLNSLRASCKIISFSPSDIETNSETSSIIISEGFQFIFESTMPYENLQNIIVGAIHVAKAEITPLDAPGEAQPQATQQAAPPDTSTAVEPVSPAAAKPAPASSPVPSQATHKPIKQNLINVNLSKLDELMDLMGELVITESMVTRSPDLSGIQHLDNFKKSARQLRKLTDELQDKVMSIRMVPVAGTFQKMTRIVRDMCHSLGKDANLVTLGEETDIDKTIIDAIADPIMHLVRNSMDHGVETPEERIAAGKNPKATVTLSAQNTGGEILVTVSDDGKGLDAEKLLNKARQNGLLVKPASEYTEKEAFALLTMPGFSTKEAVSEYSGRGVGMDVVKKNVEKIGGTVVIESVKGQGMSVFLKIPLTLAIVDGMNVSVGGSVYTLQITAIHQSFKAARNQVIIDTDGNEIIMIRGDVYPIIRLNELYGIPDSMTNIEDGILIQVLNGEQSACLFVDQLLGMQQIVVKSMPVYLNRYDIKPYGISGYTILGDGNISLILDVGSIIEKIMRKR